MIEREQLAALQTEHARLLALLDGHGIEWRLPPEPPSIEPVLPAPELEPSRFSTAEKVALFRRLFRGRTDVYPIRWESKPPANPATHRPVATSGWQVFAKNRASNAENAITVC